MRLNSLSPARGARTSRKRVGRGIGSGHGKTCGRGHKGQKSRSGGYSMVGFEGGQMPLQRRLPKRGFRSPKVNETATVRLHELNKVNVDVIDLPALRSAGLIRGDARRVKVFLSGTLDKSVTLRGVAVTKGARAAIESAGGKIE